MKRAFLVALSLVLLLALEARAGALADEVRWIQQIAGVSLTLNEETSTRLEQGFLVQNSTRTMDRIRQGLKERGWRFSDDGGIHSGGDAVLGLVAHKDGLTLEVSIQDAGILCAMELTLKGTRSSGSGRPSSPSGGSGSALGASWTLNDGNHHGTYECEGTDITINSSNNKLRFTGRCGTVTLNGSNNEIQVDARCQAVTLNGSHNDVTWSSRANPEGVPVRDNGAFNETRRN